jgi:hypothetical protein
MSGCHTGRFLTLGSSFSLVISSFSVNSKRELGWKGVSREKVCLSNTWSTSIAVERPFRYEDNSSLSRLLIMQYVIGRNRDIVTLDLAQ